MATLHGKVILILDDSSEIRLLVKNILRNDGATVHEAESVHQAIEILNQQKIDLAITDINMPGETGYDFLEQKKKQKQLESMPVIVLSGRKDQKSVYQAMALGAIDYLVKPLRTLALLQKVRKAVSSDDFKEFVFKLEDRPEVMISVSAEVTSASEIGFQVDSAVRLGSDAKVELEGELMDKLEVKSMILRTALRSSEYSGLGRYLGDINLLGLDSEGIKRLRKLLKEVS